MSCGSSMLWYQTFFFTRREERGERKQAENRKKCASAQRSRAIDRRIESRSLAHRVLLMNAPNSPSHLLCASRSVKFYPFEVCVLLFVCRWRPWDCTLLFCTRRWVMRSSRITASRRIVTRHNERRTIREFASHTRSHFAFVFLSLFRQNAV